METYNNHSDEEIIERYFNDELSNEEFVLFEKRMESDSVFKKKYEEIRTIRQATFSLMYPEILVDPIPHQDKVPVIERTLWSRVKYWAMAACIACAVFGAWKVIDFWITPDLSNIPQEFSIFKNPFPKDGSKDRDAIARKKGVAPNGTYAGTDDPLQITYIWMGWEKDTINIKEDKKNGETTLPYSPYFEIHIPSAGDPRISIIHGASNEDNLSIFSPTMRKYYSAVRMNGVIVLSSFKKEITGRSFVITCGEKSTFFKIINTHHSSKYNPKAQK